MAEDIKKVNENTADTQEGVIPDDTAENAAGGFGGLSYKNCYTSSAGPFNPGVHNPGDNGRF